MIFSEPLGFSFSVQNKRLWICLFPLRTSMCDFWFCLCCRTNSSLRFSHASSKKQKQMTISNRWSTRGRRGMCSATWSTRSSSGSTWPFKRGTSCSSCWITVPAGNSFFIWWEEEAIYNHSMIPLWGREHARCPPSSETNKVIDQSSLASDDVLVLERPEVCMNPWTGRAVLYVSLCCAL